MRGVKLDVGEKGVRIRIGNEYLGVSADRKYRSLSRLL